MRLIDADALRDALEERRRYYADEYRRGWHSTFDQGCTEAYEDAILNHLDVAPTVCCAECKWLGRGLGGPSCLMLPCEPDHDTFGCAYFERREA